MQPGQERFLAHGCPVNQCSLTGKPEDAATADLILFNGHVWRPAFARPAQQIWALFMLESPSHTPSLSDFDGQVSRAPYIIQHSMGGAVAQRVRRLGLRSKGRECESCSR